MSSSSGEDDRKMPAFTQEELKTGEVERDVKKRIRLIAQDKKRSMKRKKDVNHQKIWLEYSAFMNANLEKKKSYHESPLFVVRRSLYLISKNSIF